VPIEKLNTGGTAPALKRDDACNMVPSPPNVTTKSILGELGAGEYSEWIGGIEREMSALDGQISAPCGISDLFS